MRMLSASSPRSMRPLGDRSEAHRSVAGIRDVEGIGRGSVAHALRLPQPRQGPNDPTGVQIQHSNAVIAELGYVESLPSNINREVIDASLHVSEQQLRLENERRGIIGPTARTVRKTDSGEQHCGKALHQDSLLTDPA